MRIKVKAAGETDQLKRNQGKDVEKLLTIIWMIVIATNFFGWYLLDNKHFSLNSVCGQM